MEGGGSLLWFCHVSFVMVLTMYGTIKNWKRMVSAEAKEWERDGVIVSPCYDSTQFAEEMVSIACAIEAVVACAK
ncbi:uncharacterized protein EI97DRAFT_402400 [Westerdykella ornata]|uniref:Uncharacterized protein n=1 Tax=Westerdykella ornata TaxID=318751 RepID=A0A6A6JD85_WESOR|nr:uncharacterized protein EI97DRAFT_402400 [Westerdykella ornata]KAF2274392.1 hypothetical protein EI97DRAFT_402400 [Westerdykella ornata]